MNISLGKIIAVVAFVILGIVLGSTVGYKVGQASGALAAEQKFQEEAITQQTSAVSQTSTAYGDIPSDPLENIVINPFD